MRDNNTLALILLLFVGSTKGFFVGRPNAFQTHLEATTTSSSSSSSRNTSSDKDVPSSTTLLVESESSFSQENVLRAAASITRDACHLLGLKSVGIDYGLVRTGVAATVGYNPKPLEILSDLNNTQVCERVVEICLAEQAEQVIVGLPLHKNGTEAEQTNLTRVFAAEMATQILYAFGPDCPVYFWDERYTSKEAAARAHSRDPNQCLYGTLDAEAACIILENYYSDNGLGAERVQVSEEAMKKYKEIVKERIQKEQVASRAAMEERDARLQWRKEAMERDRQLELTMSALSANDKKKKKKKGKRKR